MCQRARTLQNVRLLVPPILTIKERRHFALWEVVPIAMFRNFLQSISAHREILVSLNQETNCNGGIVPVVSSEDSSTTTSCSMVSPWSDSTSKDAKLTMPYGTFCDDVLLLLPHNFQRLLSLGADFRDQPFNVSLGSAICSDVDKRVHNENILRRFCSSTHLYSVAFTRIKSTFGEDFLAVSCFPNGAILQSSLSTNSSQLASCLLASNRSKFRIIF